MVALPPPRALASLGLGLVGIALTGVVDWATGYEVRVFPLYFLPVALASRSVLRRGVVALSLASAFTWAFANQQAGAQYSAWFIWPINLVVQFVTVAAVGLLMLELRTRLVDERKVSRTDSLTKLLNSRGFFERAEFLLAVAKRGKTPLTFAYLDLDNFKQINDQFGHQHGDRALIETADAIRRTMRTSDVYARLGGDEFVIVLNDATVESARVALERVKDQVAAVMQQNGWPATVSVGAAAFGEAPASVEVGLKAADALMYGAKEQGKNRVHLQPA